MSLVIPFEMRNLTSFQMEKLCYDLNLEVLKEMDAEDTIELVKVNAGFHSMLSRRPWLVFGHHVHRIDLGQWKEIFLQNLPGSDLAFVKIDATRLPLAKRIHSCDELWIDWFQEEEIADEFVAILNQLKSVKGLNVERKNAQCLPKFLENFHGMVKESIWLPESIDLRNQVVSKLFENFIANQANDCEEIDFDYYWPSTLFHRYYDAFAKTSIKFFMPDVSLDEFEEIVQSLVKKQIPSKNLKAAVLLSNPYSQEVNARIVDFLSHFPGMKRINGESHQKVSKMASEVVEKYLNAIDVMNGSFFQRNIDSSRDCIYVLQSNPQEGSTDFLAFYVQPQTEMM